MDKLIVVFIIIAGMAIGSFIGGSILWLIWPVAIQAAFPGLVASGILAAKLSWWESVLLVWVFSILLKSTNHNENKK